MPIDLPARDVLCLEGDTSIAWAVFDPEWYLRSYPEIRRELADSEAAGVLAWYFEHGQQRGHSPNIFFDEAWHRRAYPAVAAMVRDGRAASAFDAWCRGGQGRSPHWLFDEGGYRRRYPDLTDEALHANQLVNGYDHFLRHGGKEGRIGHPLFDSSFFVENLEPEGAAAARAGLPFRYYLERIAAPVPEPRTTPFFDPTWYLERYPRVAEEITAGLWHCALQHYLCNNTATEFDPLADFSEHYYLAQNTGVAAAVERGDRRNGYAHFLVHGALELRSPCPAIDLRWYAAQPNVRTDLEAAKAAHAFEHWLLIGRRQTLPTAPPLEERPTDGQAATIFRRKAEALALATGRVPLDFTCAGKPAVSVVVVLHDALPLTLATLASLRSNPGDIELILVDSGSTGEALHITRYVRGARVLRFDSDIGRLRGGNAALACVTADATLFVSNEIELLPGSLAAALQRLESEPDIGAVGGKAMRPHDVLREAGGIVWRDGSFRPYLRDASPLLPEANFRRDVDYCSRAFLLVRTALLQQLEGFDDAFVPAGGEDADLCTRVWQAGFRVTYDPAVACIHMTSGGNAPSPADLERAQQVFLRKHKDWLLQRPEPDPDALVFARHAGPPVQRVLFIEDMLPLRTLGSGFVRSNDLIRAMAAKGYGVTVYPVAPGKFETSAIYADLPDNVETMYDRSIGELRDFLMRRSRYYDTIWIARTHNLDLVRPILERALPDENSRPRVVLDTEAIAASRRAERAALAGEQFDLETAIRQEFTNVSICRNVVAVNAAEGQLLRDIGCENVTVIGHVRALHPTPRPFHRRAGMLFVGAMHQPDSPNYDSLCWFVDAVLPLIERELRWETRLTVVGYTAPGVTLDRFRNHPRITLRGELADAGPLYDSHRLFVAPTRFAAGTPYKVHDAASFGLPVVATDLLRRQLDWQDGRELLSAPVTDPALFAQQVLRLYRDARLWLELREAAMERLRRENNAEDYAAVIESVLGPARRAEAEPAPERT